MPRLIGLDEAGLGPNLGPFVVAVTVWDVPGVPSEFDFWETFSDILTNSPKAGDTRLHVADSKQVFQPNRGFKALERGVLAGLGLIGHEPRSFDQLCHVLRPDSLPADPDGDIPVWYSASDFELPTAPYDDSIAKKWNESCAKHGVRLVAIKASIVEPQQFNHLIREYDNKSLVTSRVSLRLLRSVWNPDETETFIVGDKHGGRNRYDQLLSEVLDGDMIFRLEEGADRSDYRVGKTVLRFQPRAEVYGPVALASMTAKYVRELAMHQFNRFWRQHIDGLKPTQGYPVDAKRFRNEIREIQQRLKISDDVLWRNR